MEVGLHEFEHQIQVFVVLGLYYVVQLYYVGVAQVVQVADLAVGPLRVD